MSEIVYEYAKTIKALMDADWQNNEPQLSGQINEMKARFFGEINQIKHPDILYQILELDANLEMPFDVIKATYEQLVALGCHDVETLRNYAHYLLLHGPDWDSEAKEILGRLEAQKATTNLV